MDAADGNVSDAHMGIVTPTDVELVSLFHVDDVNDLRGVGADTFKDNIVVFPVASTRWGVVLNDIQPLLTVEAPCLVRVRSFAQLAL